jgi:O-antigen ligase
MDRPGALPGFLSQLYADGRLSQYLLFLACLAAVTGLFASRALVALSPILGVVAAGAHPQLRAHLRAYVRMKSVVSMALLYAFWVVSVLYTTELDVWRHEVYRKAPLITVPLVFALAVPLSAWQRHLVGLLYVGLATVLGLATMGSYLLNPEEGNHLISIGHNMPSITGVFHIHFSIMLALAFFFALLLRRSFLTTPMVRGALVACAVLIFLVMHVLAYRTGLLLIYGMVLIDAILLILLKGRFVLGLVMLTAIIGLPLLAYRTLEPVQNRVSISLDDLSEYQAGHDINNYSMARRLAAWETAIIIARQHPLLGVAPADVDAAMIDQYSYQNFGLLPENWAMTHNQYLEAMVGGGVVGLLLWLLVLFGPFLQPAQRQNPYVVHFLLMMSIANLVDSLLQLQIGFNLFVFLYGFLVVSTERETPPAIAHRSP